MSTRQKTNDNKQGSEKANKASPTQQPVTAPGAELGFQNMDPGAMQRSLSLPRNQGNRLATGIQRTYGNRATNRMLFRKIQGTPAKATGPVGPMLNRAPDDTFGGMEIDAGLEARIQQKQGHGDSLPEQTRSSMEGSFGSDFSRVGVHTDNQADTLNRAVGARAFTVGEDIFFSENEYNPGTREGDRLIAHELTHTIQQTGQKPVGQAKMKVGTVDDPYEQEADAVANQIIGQQPNHKSSSAGLQTQQNDAVQREDDEKSDEEQEEAEKEEAEKQASTAKEETSRNAPATESPPEEERTPPPASQERVKKEDEGDEEIETNFDDPSVYDTEPLGELEEPEIEEYGPDLEADYDQYSWDPTKEAALPGWDDEVAFAETFDAIEAGNWDGIKTPDGDGLIYHLGANDLNLSSPGALEEIDRDKLIGDAFAQGLLAGAIEGAIGLVVGQALGLAATKIPFIGGAVALFQILYDPKAWFESTVVGGIVDPAKDIFVGPGDEDTGWGIAAWFIERINAVLKLVTGIIGLITSIMAIVSALLYVVGNILNSFVFTAPAGAVMLAAAGTINSWMGVLGAVSTWVQIAQIVGSALAMTFRALDLKFSDADPEALMAKQAKLQGSVSDFAYNSVQVGGNLAVAAGKAKLDGKSPKEGVLDELNVKAKIIDAKKKTSSLFTDYDFKSKSHFQAPDTDDALGKDKDIQWTDNPLYEPEGDDDSIFGNLFDQPESKWVKGYEQLNSAVGEGPVPWVVGHVGEDIGDKVKEGSGGLGNLAGSSATGFDIQDPGDLDEEDKEAYMASWNERYSTGSWEDRVDTFLQEKAAQMPEKPDTEEQITANYLALVMIADEKRRLAAQMDMADQVVAQGQQQMAAGDSLKQVTAANKKALGMHQGDLGEKAGKLEIASAASNDAAPLASNNEKQSKKASGGVGGSQGLMEGGLKKAEEEDQDTGGASPSETESGGKESEEGGAEMTKVVDAGQKLAAEWQKKTAVAQVQSVEFLGTMGRIDDHISTQQQSAQEGTEEGVEAKETAAAGIEDLTANEELLLSERETVIAEGQSWMDENAVVRTSIFEELQALLGDNGAGEITPAAEEEETETTPA